MVESVRLIEILRKEEAVAQSELERAIEWHRERGGSLADLLVREGVISEDDLFFLMSLGLGVPAIPEERLLHIALAPELQRRVPSSLARRWVLLPLDLDRSEGRLSVAMFDPCDEQVLRAVRRVAAVDEVRPYLARRSVILEAIDAGYVSEQSAEALDGEVEHLHPDDLEVDEEATSELGDTGDTQVEVIPGKVSLDPGLVKELRAMAPEMAEGIGSDQPAGSASSEQPMGRARRGIQERSASVRPARGSRAGDSAAGEARGLGAPASQRGPARRPPRAIPPAAKPAVVGRRSGSPAAQDRARRGAEAARARPLIPAGPSARLRGRWSVRDEQPTGHWQLAPGEGATDSGGRRDSIPRGRPVGREETTLYRPLTNPGAAEEQGAAAPLDDATPVRPARAKPGPAPRRSLAPPSRGKPPVVRAKSSVVRGKRPAAAPSDPAPARGGSASSSPDATPPPDPLDDEKTQVGIGALRVEPDDGGGEEISAGLPDTTPTPHASVVALSEHAELTRELMEAVGVLVAMLEERIEPGAAISREQAYLCRLTARALGADAEQTARVSLAAQLFGLDSALRAELGVSAAADVTLAFDSAPRTPGGLNPTLRLIGARALGLGEQRTPDGVAIVRLVADYLDLRSSDEESDLDTVVQLLRAGGADPLMLEALVRAVEQSEGLMVRTEPNAAADASASPTDMSEFQDGATDEPQ